MKDGPKIGSWAFQTLQEDTVLLSSFPLRELKIHTLVGEDGEMVINQMVIMKAEDSDLECIMRDGGILIQHFVAGSSLSGG